MRLCKFAVVVACLTGLATLPAVAAPASAAVGIEVASAHCEPAPPSDDTVFGRGDVMVAAPQQAENTAPY